MSSKLCLIIEGDGIVEAVWIDPCERTKFGRLVEMNKIIEIKVISDIEIITTIYHCFDLFNLFNGFLIRNGFNGIGVVTADISGNSYFYKYNLKNGREIGS